MSFKSCSKCGHVWPDRADFLADAQCRLVGYQPRFVELHAGFFLFNHICGTTLALPAEEFIDLAPGPIFRTRLRGTAACARHCLNENDLAPCPAACECAYVRAVLDRVAHWPKTPPAA
jgi:hypothetical protein